MKIYADRAPTAARQIVTDVLVAAWVYAAIRAAMWLHDLVQKLAIPGQRLEGASTGLADGLSDVGSKIGRVPLVGDELTAPFNGAADAARSMADAGQQQQSIVDDLSLALSLGLLVFPLGLVLFVWLPLRVRWIRRAGAAASLRAAPAGRDLLALRALATQPLRKLTKIDPDVAQAWRRGDEDAVAALAALELKGLGLRG
ncbi:hypothetical protein ACTMTJ_25880 [Phytohabitans sp. LJ34]|uniref:hypothetical protein n=1 Tax=Phytohabitans sp. LJ34 TaxID=3452217 RepID=UPI003F89026A